MRCEISATLEGIDPDALATAQLLASELATNVVLHGGDEMLVDVSREPDRVRIEVADRGEAMPAPRRPGTHEDSGRGLGLVDSASSRWGVEPRSPGKVVWFELPVHRIAD